MKQDAVISISGFDPLSKAGLTRDIASFLHFNVAFGCSISAETIQTSQEVSSVTPRAPAHFEREILFLKKNLRAIVWKIGMLPTEAHVRIVKRHAAGIVVVDPVFSASSGGRLSDRKASQVLKELLLPGSIITPNLTEALQLTGTDDPLVAGQILLEMGAQAAVIKGGHGNGTDYVITKSKVTALKGTLYPKSVRGSGCSFASALAAELLNGKNLVSAAKSARNYVRLLIRTENRSR